jgi:hypothetical protein
MVILVTTPCSLVARFLYKDGFLTETLHDISEDRDLKQTERMLKKAQSHVKYPTILSKATKKNSSAVAGVRSRGEVLEQEDNS